MKCKKNFIVFFFSFINHQSIALNEIFPNYTNFLTSNPDTDKWHEAAFVQKSWQVEICKWQLAILERK